MAETTTSPNTAEGALARVRQALAEQLEGQRTKAQKLKDQQDVLDLMIHQISASSLPENKKSEYIARLRSAIASGNLTTLTIALTEIRADIPSEAAEAAAEVIAGQYAAEHYPDYDQYSPAGRQYIRTQYLKAMESPVMQSLMQQEAAVPAEIRKEAEAKSASNWQKLKDLEANPEYEVYLEQLKTMRRLGLTSTPHGKELLELIEQKADPQKIQKWLDSAIDHRAQLAEPVVASMMSRIPSEAREYLQQHYGKDGSKLDVRQLTVDWGKIPTKDKDAAYEAYAKANGDVSKLPAPQQRIIHMSQVMIAAEAALPMQATIALSKNTELMAQLTDKNLTVDKRADILQDMMRQNGFIGGNRNLIDYSAEKIIELFDKNKDAVQLLKDGKISELGKLYEKEFPTTNVVAAYVDAQAHSDSRRWESPEQIKAREAENAKWAGIAGAMKDFFVQQAAGAQSSATPDSIAQLSPEAKAQMQQALQALGDGNITIDQQFKPSTAPTDVPPPAGHQIAVTKTTDRTP